jgi:carboxypeptidase Q
MNRVLEEGRRVLTDFDKVVVALTLTAAMLPAQTFRSSDSVLRRMWAEGMENSSAAAYAQVLIDSIGPRLSGSPGYAAAGDWLQATYRQLGIENRREQYGTWRGWTQGAVHVDLIAPRVQTLEAKLLAWSPGAPRPIEGEVVLVPNFSVEGDATRWLETIRGKIVLMGAPEPMCREFQSIERLARPATVTAIVNERRATQAEYSRRVQLLGGQSATTRIDQAGAVAIVTSNWLGGWGVYTISGASAARAVSLALSCEDFGLLYRLATNRQGPRVRIVAEAQALGTVPMFNVVGELRGRELPNEYVVLSAHLDSWHGATGATDNGTGTVTMLEAMRILKTAYPNPRRTILVGHWGGEEQGLIGSRAFTEDHRDIVDNLQVAFNQDNGTWRVEYISAEGFLLAGGSLARWVAQLPTEISENIKLDLPGPQETGGSDHVSFVCNGAPGWRFQSHDFEYLQYTHHTNIDTYDKIVLDDLKNNATLAAMLAYLASEDPQHVPRDRSQLPPYVRNPQRLPRLPSTPVQPPAPQTGPPRMWLTCPPARRSFEP